MAVLALHLIIQVRPLELEIGLLMVKFGGCKNYNIGSTPLVLGMTLLALFILLDVAVITAMLGNIPGHILVALLAQPGLCGFVEAFVTLGALCLLLGMPLDQLARRQQRTDCVGTHLLRAGEQ